MPATAQGADPLTETLPREERIRQRANELYVQRGNHSGSQLDDWLQAEEEIFLAHQDALVRRSVPRVFPGQRPYRLLGNVRLLESGCDIVTVQKLMGHSDIDTTRKYLNPDETLKR